MPHGLNIRYILASVCIFYIPGAVGKCYPVLHPFDLVNPVLSLVTSLFQDLQVYSCVESDCRLEEFPLGLGYEVY